MTERGVRLLHPDLADRGNGAVRAAPLTLDEQQEAIRRGFLVGMHALETAMSQMLADIAELKAQQAAAARPPHERTGLAIKEVAADLGISKAHVLKLLNGGELRDVRIGTRRVVLADSVRAYLERREGEGQ